MRLSIVKCFLKVILNWHGVGISRQEQFELIGELNRLQNKLAWDMANFIANLLQHPLTKGANLDDPKTTSLRLDIIRSKPFLMKIYE